MKDAEIENFLRNYRPIGPPVQLRERILATAPAQRIWPWAIAAAVLLMSALTFHLGGQYEVASANMWLGPSAVVRVADDLTDLLGGDAPARELVTLILIEQRLRSEATPAIAMECDPVPEGEPR